MKSNNVIITGMPRSGTTLLSAMFDNADNSVALVEPADQFQYVKQHINMNSKQYVDWLSEDFADKRIKILNRAPIIDKRIASDEQISTNIFRKIPLSMSVNIKEKVRDSTTIFNRKGLGQNFNLAIKHTGPYLSILEELLETNYFKVVLIHRDPVGVICSWRDLQSHPLHYARMPGAIRFWAEMRDFIDTFDGNDVLLKQIKILEIANNKIRKLAQTFPDRLNLIAYEDLDQDSFYSLFNMATNFKLEAKRSIREYSDWKLVSKKIIEHNVNLEI